MPNEPVFDLVVRKAGGASALARTLGESIQAVSNWRQRGFPVAKCKAIEAISGVSVKKLRPNDWSDYWPDPKGAHGARPSGRRSADKSTA
jgi:DNA-binding transcriptional regulator YdaS (Cro superfamily)